MTTRRQRFIPPRWEPILYRDYAIHRATLGKFVRIKRLIATNVNYLISALYGPDRDLGCSFDKRRAKALGIDFEKEAINWGDLGVVDVVRLASNRGNKFLVYIEEAKDCPTLCDYIERYMSDWGWNVRIEAEW